MKTIVLLLLIAVTYAQSNQRNDVTSIERKNDKNTPCSGTPDLLQNCKYKETCRVEVLTGYQIFCYDIVGANKVESGGLTSKVMEVNCMETTGCIIKVWATSGAVGLMAGVVSLFILVIQKII